MSAGGGPSSEDIRERAAEWVVRVHADSCTEADWLALEDWLSGSPARQAAFDAAEALWLELGAEAAAILPGLAPDEPPTAEIIAFRPRPRTARPTRRIAPWAVAAGLAAVGAGVGGYLALRAPTLVYQTPKGATRQIQLPDGTAIALNSGSKIQVRFDRSARRVRMGEAEASFDVTHDAKRPFLISAGDEQIRVVGTEFNVLRHGDSVTLTVRRGVVEVRNPAADEPMRIPAGFQLTHHDGDVVSEVRRVQPDDAFAWRQHRLICRDRTLGEIVDDLNRTFARPIRVKGEARALTFSGVLVVDSEDAVVRRLTQFLPVAATDTPAGPVLTARD
ncbi:MAG TPA: FecR domain-containing protein [Caulobacteraceae bacterium]|nr:FecR domain-containing protein [Caulobacteraceae bacterium]